MERRGWNRKKGEKERRRCGAMRKGLKEEGTERVKRKENDRASITTAAQTRAPKRKHE